MEVAVMLEDAEKILQKTMEDVEVHNAIDVAVMLEDAEKVLQKSMEDVEVHNAIDGILRAAAGDLKGGSAEAEGATKATTSATSARKRSAVWTLFQKRTNKMALCTLCDKEIQHCSSTSNLHRHLKHMHPLHFSKLEINSVRDISAPSSAVNSSNHQLDTEQQLSNESSDFGPGTVLLGDAENAPVENVIEDMEIHGAIDNLLHTTTEDNPSSHQNTDTTLGRDEGNTVATSTRRSSAAWTHFKKADGSVAVCVLCKKRMQYSSSTSNLLRHLKKKHAIHYSRMEMQALKGNHRTSVAPTELIVSAKTDIYRSNHTASPGKSKDHLQQRERDLRDALRLVQLEEGRCLEQQRELLEKKRELEAEREALQTERRALQEEAKMLQQEKEEIRAEREKLHSEREEVERLKQALKKKQATLLGNSNCV